MVKDSFADCFIPFLTPHYREIVVVDPRYLQRNDAGYYGHIPHNRCVDLGIAEIHFFTDNNISGVFTGE